MVTTLHRFAIPTKLFVILIAVWSAGIPAKESNAQDPPPATRGARGDKATVPPTEKHFSGPQIGETLGEIPVWVHLPEDQPSEKKDLGEVAKMAPVAIAFMHEKSRPAFALARIMSSFAERRKKSGLQVYFVVLTEDRSSTEKWLGQIDRYFHSPTQLAVADGGIEGPGSLGLNRLVAMTILIAQEGKVTGNFALTQVSTAIDGPEILKVMNKVSGGGEIPSLEELTPRAKR